MLQAPFDRSKIPHKPGVYLYKNKTGQIIYVGKAVDLFSRVSSYFADYHQNPKTAALVEKIADVEIIVVESEIEALILEANLIKKNLPLYNIKLTDDKDYLYIKVAKGLFPKIITSRKKELAGALACFGPFPSAATVRTTLKRLRRIFPWCQNPPKINVIPSREGIQKTNEAWIPEQVRDDNVETTITKPCFYYHLGLCPGPCAGRLTQAEYQQIIKNFIKFMNGKKEELVEDLEAQMKRASLAREFELAQSFKKTLEGVKYLVQPNRAQIYLENPNFLEDQNQQALVELQQVLRLPTLPVRIECFDISNTQGQQSTGSLVVLTHGEIDKSQYRKFKIQITGKPNDYAMHAEMMRRRLKHLEWPYPDLMVIDGGRGQVRAALVEIENRNLKIPVFGLAKRKEWLYPPEGPEVKLPKSSLSLRLLQKIRDEAHRFAVTYHRKLRGQQFLK